MIPLIRNITKEDDRQKIVVGVKDSANRPNHQNNILASNCPPSLILKLKTEIGLRLCFAPLPLVSSLGLLCWSILLLKEQLVIN